MTLTEVIDGLKPVLENGIDNLTFRAAVHAAITHLDPYTQPITPERLEAAGFIWDQAHGLWLYRNIGSHEFILAWRKEDGMRRWTPRAGNITNYPGVRTMGDVLGLIRFLEGE